MQRRREKRYTLCRLHIICVLFRVCLTYTLSKLTHSICSTFWNK